jgi:hypothetical protein
MRKASSTAQARQGRGLAATSMRTAASGPAEVGRLAGWGRARGPRGVEAGALYAPLLCIRNANKNRHLLSCP